MSAVATTLGGRRRMGLCAVTGLLLAVLVQSRIEGVRRSSGVHPLLYLPSGKYLRVMALGFDGLLADVLYLWSIQYYGNYDIRDRYDYLEHIYDQVITELDPHYLDPYLIGALIMTSEARQPEMALRLLDKGFERNPDQWIMPFEHPLVRRLYAEMYNRAGDKRTSLREWSEIYQTSTDDYVRNVAWNHVHDLKVSVDVADLTDAVAGFRARHGRPPRRLQDLLASGLLGVLPRDPEDRDYIYDPENGVVRYRGGLVLAR